MRSGTLGLVSLQEVWLRVLVQAVKVERRHATIITTPSVYILAEKKLLTKEKNWIMKIYLPEVSVN